MESHAKEVGMHNDQSANEIGAESHSNEAAMDQEQPENKIVAMESNSKEAGMDQEQSENNIGAESHSNEAAMDQEQPENQIVAMESNSKEAGMDQEQSGNNIFATESHSKEASMDQEQPENKPAYKYSFEVLKTALQNLKETSPKVQPPKYATPWQDLFENAKCKSWNKSFSYEEHLHTWFQLILTIEDCLQSDVQTDLLECYRNAITLLPIRLTETDTTWIALINGLYSHILMDEIPHSAALPVLEKAEERFKFSLVHARAYWITVMKNEKQLMKKEEKPIEEQHHCLATLWKRRLSNQYINAEEDYNEFTRWSYDVNLIKDLKMDVQHAYLNNCSKRDLSFVTQMLDKTNKRSSDWPKHHLLFEKWVDELCGEETPNLYYLETVCEEMIMEEPESLCYDFIFINALALTKFKKEIQNSKKIYNSIVHGFNKGKTTCVGMEQRFLEQSLVVASATLPLEQALELIDTAIALFPVTNDIDKWYASSRGVIIAISNLIHANQIGANNFDKYFKKIIEPCTLGLFQYSVVPPELADKTGYEIPFINLLKLFITTNQSFHGFDQPELIEMWTNYFFENENPVMLVEYVDFVRNRGSFADALEASRFALEKMAAIEKVELTPKPITRNCHIRLLKYHLETLSATGAICSQIETSKQLQNKLNSSFTESEIGASTQGLLARNPMLHESEVMSNSVACENSIVNKLKSLNVGADTNGTDGDSEKPKVFVSNLNYKATEDDLISAFKEKGFPPNKVTINRTALGKNLGYGNAYFDCQDTADQVVVLCDKFLVCGRTTFVSRFNPVGKKSAKKPVPKQPTVLNFSNLPVEYNDEEKITNKLRRYGHIKNVVIEHDDTSLSMFAAKVEFYMPEDANNAYSEVIRGKLFGDVATCRIGYSPKKRPLKEREAVDKKQPEKDSNQNKMDFIEEDIEKTPQLDMNIVGPKIPPNLDTKKPKTFTKLKTKKRGFFNPVPLQVLKDQPKMSKRTHMKSRLSIGAASTSQSSSDSPNISPAKKAKRIATDKGEQDQTVGGMKTRAQESKRRVSMRLRSRNAANPAEETVSHLDEEKASGSAKPSLSNEDFQKMFKKQ